MLTDDLGHFGRILADLAALLDLAAEPLLLLTTSRRLEYANRKALDLLDRAEIVLIDGGILRLRRAEEDTALRDAVAGLAVIGQTSTVCLRSREGFVVAILDLYLMVGGGLVALRVTNLLPGAVGVASRLASVFGLTSAEARVAAAFLAGLSLSAIAERHGVQIGTVRMQIKRIRAKTGTSSQVHLANLLERAGFGFQDTQASADRTYND